MPTMKTSDAITTLLAALPRDGQPALFYSTLEQVLQDSVGFIFLTLFVIQAGQTLRVHTTNQAAYPIGVRKPMASTPWGDLVIGQKQSFLATDRHAVADAFFDHAKIDALGCGSAIGVPVVYDGTCLGVLNLNHREHYYDARHVAVIEALAPTLIPVFLETLQQQDSEI